MSHAHRLVIFLFILCATTWSGCGDDSESDSQSPQADAVVEDGATTLADGAGALDAATGEDAALVSDNGASLDTNSSEDDSATGGTDAMAADTALSDSAGAPDAGAPDAGAPDAGAPDAGAPDAGAPDAGAPDAGAPDAGAPDAGGADPCGVCPVDKQPQAPHPGAKGKCSLLTPKQESYGSGFGQGYKKMLVFRPGCAGSKPVLFFVHGKSLYETGGAFNAKLGAAYEAYMKHVASHGYIAVFVRVEQGLLDADHARMADDLLAATKKLFDVVSVANNTQVVFAGHSMGAKVALLAAAKTLAQDSKNAWVNPRAVLAFSPSNEKPPFGGYTNAVDSLKKISAAANVSFTFVQPEDDAIAPYKDPAKPNAVALYDALQVNHKQIILLHGTGKNDPNPPSSPELHDDHAAALTVVGKPGGVADFAMPASYLDALDWYGFWKITVGAMDYHFKKGDKKWAYGALRSHGGVLPKGKVVKHEVFKEQWKKP